MFSEKYLASKTLFSIYIFIIIFKALNLSVLITAADKQKYLIRNGVILIISNCIIIFIIKNLLGFYYLTLAPVISTLIMNILMMFDVKKIYRQKSVWNLIPSKNLLQIFAKCCIICLLVILIKNMIGVNSIYYAILLVPVLYIFMLVICVCTNKGFKEQLKKLFSKFKTKKIDD